MIRFDAGLLPPVPRRCTLETVSNSASSPGSSHNSGADSESESGAATVAALRTWLSGAHDTPLASALAELPRPASEAVSRRYRRLLTARLDAEPAVLRGGTEDSALQRLAMTPEAMLELDLRRNVCVQRIQAALSERDKANAAGVRSALLRLSMTVRALAADVLSPDMALRCFVEALKELPMQLDQRLRRLDRFADALQAALPEILERASALLQPASAKPLAAAAVDISALEPALRRIADSGQPDASLARRLLEISGTLALGQRLDLLQRIQAEISPPLSDAALFALIKLALVDESVLLSANHPVRMQMHRRRELDSLLDKLALGAAFVESGLGAIKPWPAEQVALAVDQLQAQRRAQRESAQGDTSRRVADEVKRLGVVHSLPASGQRFLHDVWAPLLTLAMANRAADQTVWQRTTAALEPVLAILCDRINGRVRPFENALNTLADQLFQHGLRRERIDDALQMLRQAYDELRNLQGPAPSLPSSPAKPNPGPQTSQSRPGVGWIDLPDET